MDIMKAFGEATGLQINMQKSSVALIRCANIDIDDVLQDFPRQRVNFPLQYLGLPLTVGRLKMYPCNTSKIELKKGCRLAGAIAQHCSMQRTSALYA
jgi:hypothetical protein